MKNFPHRSIFTNEIRATRTMEVEQYRSFASLNGLAKLEIPQSLDLAKNPDLLLAVYNGAVINRLNRNDDGISTQTAMAIKNQFIHKPTNIEHKKRRTVGHIVGVGWSSFGENELLSDAEVAKMDDPFNLVISSVVYRSNEEKLSDALIDSTDETSPLYHTISSSWEVAFEDYHIVLGSKNVNEAEIITDPKQIAEYSKFLRAYGGKGVTNDGVYVGRLIVGDEFSVLPVGFAFTSNPAAEVEGVIVKDFSDMEEDDEEEEDSTHHEDSERIAANNVDSDSATELIINSDDKDSVSKMIGEQDEIDYISIVKAVNSYRIAAKSRKK